MTTSTETVNIHRGPHSRCAVSAEFGRLVASQSWLRWQKWGGKGCDTERLLLEGPRESNRSTSTSHKTARTVSEGRCVPIVGCPRPLLCCESCTWGREMWVGLVQTPPWSSSTRRRVAEHWVKKKRKWCCCWEAWVEASMRRDTGRMEVQSCRWLGWLAGVGTRNQTNQSKQSTERQETGAQTRRSIILA